MDDNELMARVKVGDMEALGELIGRHRGWAEGLAMAMTGDRGLAEDVVQEAFARVYLLRQEYRATFQFRTYLGVLVRHLCVDQLRRMKRGPLLPGELPEVEVPSAESVYLQGEERMRLWDAIAALPETDRKLLTGYALEEKSCRQLAAEQGMTTGQVKTRLHRIRKALKAKERDGE